MNEQEYGKIIAYNLRKIMYDHGTTQAELSKTLGLSKATISSWMNGTRIPRMPMIDLLCNYFNVNRTDIMDPHEDEPAKSVKEEATDLLDTLPEEQQAEALEYIRYLKSKSDR